ncbi:MAG TPA: 5-deoxy-glucuronate isomerase [Candidatus Dormibacteraeota bacterium]|nr:5-deoxy-glucuronate isomerase [Candidatus Dormibacteraeota bacterium]
MPFAPAAEPVTPGSAGWRYVGFEVVSVRPGERLERTTEDREHCLVVIGGRLRVNGWDLGSRRTPFEGPPEAAYFPPHTRWRLEAVTEAEVAIGSAPAEVGGEARPLRRPALVERGRGSTFRRIYNILMEDEPAERLLVTEVLTPGGNWSSYPPHKHDTEDLPHETYLEETYYHRLARPEGFAIQRIYTDDGSLDETLTVHDRAVVLVPRGYHPVVAAAGYDLYYLNVMAGPIRRWLITVDPAHRWLS